MDYTVEWASCRKVPCWAENRREAKPYFCWSHHTWVRGGGEVRRGFRLLENETTNQSLQIGKSADPSKFPRDDIFIKIIIVFWAISCFSSLNYSVVKILNLTFFCGHPLAHQNRKVADNFEQHPLPPPSGCLQRLDPHTSCREAVVSLIDLPQQSATTTNFTPKIK